MKIDFYYDFISPFSYLAAMQIGEIQAESGAEILWCPVSLPKLIHLSGNTPPAMSPNKGRYLARDLKRKAKKLDLPMKLIRPGAFDSRPALYIACSLDEADRQRFSLALFRGLWSGEVDVTKSNWLSTAMQQFGLPESWLGLDTEKEKAALQLYTDQALAAGAFGAPSFVLHGRKRKELFFGLDHLPYLLEACTRDA